MSHTCTHTDIYLYIFQDSLGWCEEKDGESAGKMIVCSEKLSEPSATQPTILANPGTFLFTLVSVSLVWTWLRFLLANSFYPVLPMLWLSCMLSYPRLDKPRPCRNSFFTGLVLVLFGFILGLCFVWDLGLVFFWLVGFGVLCVCSSWHQF